VIGRLSCSLLLSSDSSRYSRTCPRSMVSRAVTVPWNGDGIKMLAVSPGTYSFLSATSSMRSWFCWPQLIKASSLTQMYVALCTSFSNSSNPRARTLNSPPSGGVT